MFRELHVRNRGICRAKALEATSGYPEGIPRRPTTRSSVRNDPVDVRDSELMLGELGHVPNQADALTNARGQRRSPAHQRRPRRPQRIFPARLKVQEVRHTLPAHY